MFTASHVQHPDYLAETPDPAMTADCYTGNLRAMLEETVARVFDVDLDLMRLPTRGRANVAMARQVAMYLAHVCCGLTLTETGQAFNRDRTTVAHACQVVEDRREDEAFDQAIELLECVTKILAAPQHI